MAGGIELIEFALFLFGLPMAISLVVVLIYRWKMDRPVGNQAWFLALPGPSLEMALGVFLIVSAAKTTCVPDHVCDSLVGPIGMLMILSALVSYALSGCVAQSILRTGRAS